jgi:hypothetical protein
MDWDEIFVGGILAIIGAISIFLLIVLCGGLYYSATSEINTMEMELQISAKDKETTSSVKMVGKILVPQTDTDYFIYGDGIEVEVDYNSYNSLSIGDKVVVIKKDWVREEKVWKTDYYLKE